jgi:hypothetical protein
VEGGGKVHTRRNSYLGSNLVGTNHHNYMLSKARASISSSWGFKNRMESPNICKKKLKNIRKKEFENAETRNL